MIDGTEAAKSVGPAAPAGRPELPTTLMRIPAPQTGQMEPTVDASAGASDGPEASEPTTTMLVPGPRTENFPTRAPSPDAAEPGATTGAEPNAGGGETAAGTRAPATAQPQATTQPEKTAEPEADADAQPAQEADAPEPPTTVIAAEATTTGSVWPGLTAAGLPTRVPRQAADEDTIKEAFFQSWEAAPTNPTPLTRPPFTPTYLGEPPRPRTSWAGDLPVLAPLASDQQEQPDQPGPQKQPDPKEPPHPAEPPQPKEPPEPKEPPAPPPPPPGPTPFPSPTPVPRPPEPVPPAPLPTPPIPPGPPVPTPPAPFPPPPGPVPPPPAIVAGAATPKPAIVPGVAEPPATVPFVTPAAPPERAPAPAGPGPSVYQGGNYAELSTEPITGVSGPRKNPRESTTDHSGSLTGHLLSREMRERRERRRRMKSVMWVVSLLVLFGAFLATVVVLLAGDFLGGLFDTFARWAG